VLKQAVDVCPDAGDHLWAGGVEAVAEFPQVGVNPGHGGDLVGAELAFEAVAGGGGRHGLSWT
jgi:hypothetical protein